MTSPSDLSPTNSLSTLFLRLEHTLCTYTIYLRLSHILTMQETRILTPHPIAAQSPSSTSSPARAWKQKRANLGQASAKKKSVLFYCLCTATRIYLSHGTGIGAEAYPGFSFAAYHVYTGFQEHHFLSCAWIFLYYSTAFQPKLVTFDSLVELNSKDPHINLILSNSLYFVQPLKPSFHNIPSLPSLAHSEPTASISRSIYHLLR